MHFTALDIEMILVNNFDPHFHSFSIILRVVNVHWRYDVTELSSISYLFFSAFCF